MHQPPPHSASAALNDLPRSRILLEASSKYCSRNTYANNDLVRCRADSLYFVEEGLAIATTYLANSKRQVVALYVPGDIINYERLFFRRTFVEVSVISNLSLAHISAADFIKILDSDREYERCFSRFVAYQSVLAQAWIVNLGRRSATERTAHLICELFCRLQAAPNMPDNSRLAPITQNVLADMLGLSLVHLNRSLKHIKESGLAAFVGKRLCVFDWQGLAKLADFDRGYLDVA